MSAIFPILSVLGYALCIQSFSSYGLKTSIFIAICCLINLLYLFGLSHYLEFGSLILFWVGIGWFLFLGIGKQKLCSQLSRWTPFYLIPFALFFAVIPADFFFTGWDEFSHWALSIKFLFTQNRIFEHDAILPFSHYPPAQQLFQYWFLKSSATVWNEKLVLYSQSFFVLSGLLLLSDNKLLCNRNQLLFFFSSILIYQWLSNVGFNFFHIYSDGLLGIIFACALVLGAQSKKSITDKILLGIVLGTLVLQKQIGLVLALIVIEWLILEWLKILLSGQSKNILIKHSQTVIVSLIFVSIAFISWRTFSSVPQEGLQNSLPNFSFVQNTYSRFFASDSQALVTAIWETFLNKVNAPFIKSDFIDWHLSLLSFFGICFAFIIFFRSKSINLNHQRSIFLASFILINVFLYITFLLLSYFLFFAPFEAKQLASFDRYMGSVTVALSLVLGLCFFNYLQGLGLRLQGVLALIFILICLIFIPKNTFIQLIRGMDYVYESELTASAATNVEQVHYDLLALINKIPKSAISQKIYFVHQNSTGYSKWAFGYLAYPNSIQGWCWSLGKPYFNGDIWTCENNLAKSIKDYDYLVLYDADTQFWNDNRASFNTSESNLQRGIYRINKTKSSGVLLTLIQ